MASPRVLIQILVTGTKILGKAFLEAGRQAAKNARTPAQGAIGSDVAGVRNATTGSITDRLTREHRMTLEEAHLILNVKRGEEMEKILNNYEHLFKANSPPPPPPKGTPTSGSRAKATPAHSHYLQSKVIRARERIEAELEVASETEKVAESESASSSPPSPPQSGSPS
ncbi:protein transporter [Dendrothele bispora CBS 962.96]|uniref:Mitochondrial import inner membrane translocase subunit TIM16 n=1 Tax=Dendrothele bispora (strain CBS 962.96) TaxID=1314807 RepID=A0A4S8M184_DENBC|nr:protein transporter [Dendrothele bispora CBS 962.96]